MATRAAAQSDSTRNSSYDSLTISGGRTASIRFGITEIVDAPSSLADSVKRSPKVLSERDSFAYLNTRPPKPFELDKSTIAVVEPPPKYAIGQSEIDWNRFAIATGGLTAVVAGLHIYQANAWWSDQRGDFHVFNDAEYKDDFDKFGHAFGGYYSAHFFDEAFTWSGFNELQSAALGATCAALWELYIEIEDGFARDWGFSHGDAIADLVGAGFYFARKQVPYLDNVKYKWMYWPSKQMLENRPDIPGQTLTFIEDYAGQSFWVSLNVNGLLPEAADPYWPDWLNLAVGVADYSLGAPTFEERKKAWMISLDYDLGKVIPESDSPILNFIRRGLDYWHFPAPAMRISPDPRFFILFPFRMSIG
ncbi:MAG TPA: DUF2279 domain-containing protein [Candidatus Kapabacteria bacterium]|nr:DUF2279 domain-containing protein [Candidatus Kapabacteria bacterium]